MVTSDRIFPLCELLLGAAYADGELDAQEKNEVRALMVEMAGEMRVEVEACMASFDPAKFDLPATASAFRNDSEEERLRILLLACKVKEADEVQHFAEDDYLRELALVLGLPPSALDGLVLELEDMADAFDAVASR